MIANKRFSQDFFFSNWIIHVEEILTTSVITTTFGCFQQLWFYVHSIHHHKRTCHFKFCKFCSIEDKHHLCVLSSMIINPSPAYASKYILKGVIFIVCTRVAQYNSLHLFKQASGYGKSVQEPKKRPATGLFRVFKLKNVQSKQKDHRNYFVGPVP